MNLSGRRQYFSIPNLFSYFRILLVPFIIYYYVYTDNLTLVGILLVISGLTDAVDGYIARKYNQITDFGKIIDPIADKITQFAVILMLTSKYPITWVLFGMYLFKDILITFANYYLFKKRNLKPVGSKWYGRLCTLLFYVLVIVLLFFNIPSNIVFTVTIIYTLYVGLTSDLYSYHFYMRYKNSKRVNV